MTAKLTIIISIPHASTFVPKNIKERMLISDFDIRNHADLYTEKIYNVHNAHKVVAKISRLVADVNRAPDDLETESRLCADGVVIRTTPDGKRIYDMPPSVKDIVKRIEQYHDTYHDTLEDTIAQKGIRFFIDGHSMWSTRPSLLKGTDDQRPDIALGNRDYTTCSREQTHFIKHFFEAKGYSVLVNDPYKGKYVLGFHCNRKKTRGVQIEFNRKLYLAEKNLKVK